MGRWAAVLAASRAAFVAGRRPREHGALRDGRCGCLAGARPALMRRSQSRGHVFDVYIQYRNSCSDSLSGAPARCRKMPRELIMPSQPTCRQCSRNTQCQKKFVCGVVFRGVFDIPSVIFMYWLMHQTVFVYQRASLTPLGCDNICAERAPTGVQGHRGGEGQVHDEGGLACCVRSARRKG